MGEVDSKFRGDGDIPLTNLINSMTDAQFTQFCIDGENAGAITAVEYADKYTMIERLPTIDQELKDNIMKNLTEGRGPW